MASPEVGKVFLEALIRQQRLNDTEGSFDAVALHGLRDIRASSGQLDCSLLVTREVQNRYGTLHGGCIATIVDTVGSAALVTQSEKSGVSLGISVDYLSPQPGGEVVDISAKVVRVGKTIATITVELRNQKSQKLVAIGRHVKFMSEGEPTLQQWSGLQQSKL